MSSKAKCLPVVIDLEVFLRPQRGKKVKGGERIHAEWGMRGTFSKAIFVHLVLMDYYSFPQLQVDEVIT